MRLATFVRHLVGGVELPAPSSTTAAWNVFNLGNENLQAVEAYARIPDIYACISRVATAGGELPLGIFDGETEQEPDFDKDGNPNAAALFADPNPDNTTSDVIVALLTDLLTHGNAYLFLDYLRQQRPQQLWTICPPLVEPIVLKGQRIVDHFNVDVGTGKPVEVPREQMVQIKLYDPNGTAKGLSPIGVLNLSYKAQRNAMRWMDEFYRRGGIVPGVFTMSDPNEDLSHEQEERFVESLTKKFREPFRPVYLPAAVKHEVLGMSVTDMEFVEMKKLTRSDICNVYRVPESVLGSRDEAGLSQAGIKPDWTMFYLGAVFVAMDQIKDGVNARIFKPLVHQAEFGTGLELRYDRSGVLAIQEEFLDQANSYVLITKKAIMLPEEARARLGLPELSPEDLKRLNPAPPPALNPNANPNADPNADPNAAAGEAAKNRGRGPTSGDTEVPSSRAGREALVLRAEMKAARFEPIMRTGWRQVFRQQEARVIERFSQAQAAAWRGAGATNGTAEASMRTEPAWTAAIDVDDLLQVDGADVTLIRRFMRRVADGAGTAELSDLARDISFDVDSLRAIEWLRQRSDVAIVGTTRTTRDQLRESLGEGGRAGETHDEMIARIREVFTERYANQGDTIVRTETAGAYNFGRHEAWHQSGVVEKKQWVTAGDELVRPAHADADGQIVLLGESFSVGSFQMDFPGDSSHGAGPDLVCNCRCVAAPIVEASTETSQAAAGPRNLSEVFG